MKIAIDCVHYPISPRISSHRSSWARYWKWVLQTQYPDAEIEILGRNDHDRWSEFDEVYFYQGMEWTGALNLAGGVSEYTLNRMRTFASTLFRNVFSLDVDMPDYYELMKLRKIDDPTLKKDNQEVQTITLPESRKIVLGDSHSLSVMDSDGEYVKVYRTDFKTLNGALNTGLEKVRDINWLNVRECTFFFGMIDLRHHVFRHGGFQAINDLVMRYELQLQDLERDWKIGIELAQMYPMTRDSRKLPKSGFFEKTPFYGDLSDRIKATNYFNEKLEEVCKKNGWKFYKHPDVFTDDDGTMDEFFMEKPRSVHMSPEFYRFDLEEGKTREW